MAFTPETFVLCSKFNLFKAHANLWIYTTQDSLETCLGENYFRPRENVKNQDSPKVGDVIQLLTQGYQMSFVRIVSKTEKPYNITVARTFLETEANLIAELAQKANKTTDFATPITDSNKGITQTEQAEIESLINNAANSGVMITPQGVWYAKMDSNTVAPSADEGATYADFSQLDADNNPIIVIYTYTSGAWVLTDTITPPAASDGYVAITLKFWDIPQQSGQQGGRVLWNHTAKTFTAYPTIVSYNDVTLTGDSTVVMPDSPTDGQIINLEYFNEHMRGAGRNVGDVFYTARKETEINGAVACDGSTYQTTDYSGSEAPGALLTANKLPYVSLAEYADLLAANGSVGVFGWDGIGTTDFRVPTLTDIFLETGTVGQVGDYLPAGLPSVEHTHGFSVQDVNETTGSNAGTGTGISFGEVNKTTSENSPVSEIYGNSDTVQPNAVRFRAMIQLYTGVSDVSNINIYDSTITITQGGVPKGSFTLNQPNNETIELDTSGSGLPDQTGHSGEFLTTNGTDASWGAAPVTSVNSKTGVVVLSASDVGALPDSTVIPAAQVNSDWNSASGVSQILNKPSLATVATSGSYADLSNKPTIPTVNNSTITITQGGVTKGSFTLNQSSGDTIALDASGNAEIEYATYGTTTYQQISDWLTAGKDVLCIYNGITYRYGYDSAGHWFVCPNPNAINLVYVQTNNTWTSTQQLKQNQMQYSTMPTANIGNSDKIVQYVGTTDTNYTNGYFYVCVNNGGVYSWQQIDVQPASGGSLPSQTGHSGKFLTTDGTDASWGAVPVTSVNSKTGAVTLSASDVGALPASTVIPTVNDATITITQGGVTKGSFTLNQSSGDTIALDAGSGSAEIEWATYGTTTYQQISDWLAADKDVFCIYNGFTYRYSYNSASTHRFEAILPSQIREIWVATDDSWSYQGTNKQNLFQYSPLPTANASNVGEIYQYTGTTDANYTQGYFYVCVNNGGVYSWQPIAPHTVIAFQAPSAQNNYTWYRKYADGWVEQGGFSTNATNPSITLPIAMSDTNYWIGVSGLDEYAGERAIRLYTTVLSETQFQIINTNSGGSGSDSQYWEVKGIAGN